MKRQSRNQQNKFSQDRNLKIESLENRNLMTVGNVIASAVTEFATSTEESVTIGHEKNITSMSNGQCQGACYVRDQGKDKLDGFFTQSGSAAELQDQQVEESVAILGQANGVAILGQANGVAILGQQHTNNAAVDGFFTQSGSAAELQDQQVEESVAILGQANGVAILGQANGIEQARDATYEDYWDMDMSIVSRGNDEDFTQSGSAAEIVLDTTPPTIILDKEAPQNMKPALNIPSLEQEELYSATSAANYVPDGRNDGKAT